MPAKDEGLPETIDIETGEIVETAELTDTESLTFTNTPVPEDYQEIVSWVNRAQVAWAYARDAEETPNADVNPVYGTLIGAKWRDDDPKFGEYLILTLDSPQTTQLRTVHCFHKVLRAEFEKRIERGHLWPGDQISIKYIGLGKAQPKQSPPKIYRVEVRRPGQPFSPAGLEALPTSQRTFDTTATLLPRTNSLESAPS